MINSHVFQCTGLGTGNYGCGTTCLITTNDIFVDSDMTITGLSQWFYFRCSHCGQRTEIMPTDLDKKEKNFLLCFHNMLSKSFFDK